MKTRKKESGGQNSTHRVVNLSPLLGNVALEKVLANVVRGTLGLLGYACAIPEPDTGGHDLWFAWPAAPEICRCQLKAFGRYELFKQNCARQYDQNIELEWFLRALHQPLSFLVIGLADHGRSVCWEDFRPPVYRVEEKLSQFHVGYIPASIFRGAQYKLSAKKERGAINLHVKYIPQCAGREIVLYGDAYRRKPGHLCFSKEVTRYFDVQVLQPSCLTKAVQGRCRRAEWKVSPLEKPIVGRGNRSGPKFEFGS